ncbi:unnamed protein product (macronuclear) [Paramecium tetraurelia]|uniref:Uncharacterized protein n=1 Tax=Paramecium tetraurelia TaxID=5888 RepID=A0E3M0_PARTE|nr:uncharacterized protein GSPATT00023060001 [Paramecium tetraurelia]CAK89887.1 unnamed protein product [Paramecium tetraurelia]|eukprot:XP_001457284.1 hypothetical protein (macronuclear) [Paramecium tetraurelia strain d4-2]
MILENPSKIKWKQQYIKKYRALLGISNLKVIPPEPTENNITPLHLDYINKQRSKSLKQNDESILQSSDRRSLHTKIYTACEMNQIINHARICGLLNDKQSLNSQNKQNQSLLEQNRKYFQDVRNLENSWNYKRIRQEEQNRLFNSIPMEQHYKIKLKQKETHLNIQQLIQEQRTLFLTNNTQQNHDLSGSSSLE